jgi:MFS transporter, DHA1 family, inner membrane transport protein
MPLALLALAIASFCIGTTEFVIMGLLPDVARDLGVTIPVAGLLVSGYALGVVFGAPIVAAAVIRVPRKPALLGMVGMFILGNVLCALAPNYFVLLLARIVTAFCHGAFFGIGSVVAADLVAPNRRASAIALVFGGLTLANVLGVPFGTALGNALGWRSTFWAVAGVGAIAAVAIAAWLPATIPMKPADLRGELRVLRNPQVLLAMAISVLASASLFSVFTYITPLLERVTGLTPVAVTYALLVFGAGLTAGNFLGGRLADWRLMPSLLAVMTVLAVACASFALTSHNAIASFLTLFVWGALAFAVVPLLQMRIVNEAADAPNLASTLNQGAFNLGNATGAWLGGAALVAGVTYAQLPIIGGAVAVLALAGAFVSTRLREPGQLASAA